MSTIAPAPWRCAQVSGHRTGGLDKTPDAVVYGVVGGWIAGTGAGAYYGYTLSGGGAWGVVVAALLTAPIGGAAGAVAGGMLGGLVS